MHSDNAETAPDGDARATAVGNLNPGRIHGTRVVLWVASDSGFDAGSLAKHLAAAHGGAATVTIVSVEEISASGSPAKTLPSREQVTSPPSLRNDRHGAHATRQELRFRRRRNRVHPMAERAAQPLHQGLLRRIGDAIGGKSGDLPSRSTDAATASGCAMQMPPCISRAHAVVDPLQAPALGNGAPQPVRSLDDVKDALTPREAQVVAHLREGFTNKEIARRLGIMEDTVKKHLQGVFAKLGVHRRALVVLRPTGGL